MKEFDHEDSGFVLNRLKPRVHPAVAAGLIRHGAIVEAGYDGGDAWGNGGARYAVSDFGQDLIRLLT
jgi:hypothetical protein